MNKLLNVLLPKDLDISKNFVLILMPFVQQKYLFFKLG